MDISKFSERAIKIKEQYAVFQSDRYRPAWNVEDFAMGFVKDVGDLMKLVMAKKGIREVDDLDEKLAHELSDCLWSILVLANEYSVDIEASFLKTMDEIQERLTSPNNS